MTFTTDTAVALFAAWSRPTQAARRTALARMDMGHEPHAMAEAAMEMADQAVADAHLDSDCVSKRMRALADRMADKGDVTAARTLRGLADELDGLALSRERVA